jgi:hypothetical protein
MAARKAQQKKMSSKQMKKTKGGGGIPAITAEVSMMDTKRTGVTIKPPAAPSIPKP